VPQKRCAPSVQGAITILAKKLIRLERAIVQGDAAQPTRPVAYTSRPGLERRTVTFGPKRRGRN